jgi:CubicO group peptidase (beta-lactamase class C family)
MDVFADAGDILDELGVRFQASSSEATAAAMLAASINYPLRGAVTWKSTVGTNVASDALSNLASAGVQGGALIILGEDYGPGVDMHTPFESWSMGKSLTGTLMAVLIEQGVYRLEQRAPIPEWQDDDRRDIRIMDIMRMSSGIRIVAPQDPDYDPDGGYPDHLYLYTGPNAFEWAATRPQQWMPNTVGRYRNTDPALTNYLIRLGVEGRGDDYHSFPQRNLFDRLGIRHIVMETDPYGNFLTQGYEFGSARDWARIGNLYLQDGVWEGERILPEGYVDYAMEYAPAWIADDRPIYGGGFLWKDLGFPIEDEYGAFAGAGGQYTIIIPSRGLVIARLGKYKGSGPGGRNLNRAIEMILEAVPAP